MSGAAGQLAAVERMGQPTAVKRLGRSASTPAHTGLAQLAPGLNRKAEEEAASADAEAQTRTQQVKPMKRQSMQAMEPMQPMSFGERLKKKNLY